MSKIQGEEHVLISPGMKIPRDISKHLTLYVNEECIFELILQNIIHERENLESCVIYFLRIVTCTRVLQ